MTTEERTFDALNCAITAAEAAMQATCALWETLTYTERDRWLEQAATCWPRRDIFLKTILPAAAQVVADERSDDTPEAA